MKKGDERGDQRLGGWRTNLVDRLIRASGAPAFEEGSAQMGAAVLEEMAVVVVVVVVVVLDELKKLNFFKN